MKIILSVIVFSSVVFQFGLYCSASNCQLPTASPMTVGDCNKDGGDKYSTFQGCPDSQGILRTIEMITENY